MVCQILRFRWFALTTLLGQPGQTSSTSPIRVPLHLRSRRLLRALLMAAVSLSALAQCERVRFDAWFRQIARGTSFFDTLDALDLGFSIVEDHIRGRDQVNVLEVLDFLRVAAPRTRFARRKISGLRQECFTFIRGLKRD